MNHILDMAILGLLAGMISGLWTRIIRTNMIFRKFGRWLTMTNNRHLIEHNCDSMLVKFIRCIFCLTPWLVFVLELFYIIIYTPHWAFALIGVFTGLGAGNFTCEVIHTLRNEG